MEGMSTLPRVLWRPVVRESAVLALVLPLPVTYSLGLLGKKLIFCLKTIPA